MRGEISFHLSLKALDERLGEADMDEWRENAPDVHPSQREPGDEE